MQRVRDTVGITALSSAALVLIAAARRACRGRRSRWGASKAGIEGMVVLTAAASGPEQLKLQADGEITRLPMRKGSDRARRKRLSVRFIPGVTCIAVCDQTELPLERRAELWWQRQDFEQFLRVRVEIGAAYQAAAKKIGVDVMQVASIGSHGDQGYQAMKEAAPSLANESRRGLGLGRRRQRAKNRDAYIAAVVEEQLRQQEEAAEFCDAENWDASMLDAEKLAGVARRISEMDGVYAQYLAQCYYENDFNSDEVNRTEEAAMPLEDHDVTDSATVDGHLTPSAEQSPVGKSSQLAASPYSSPIDNTSAECSDDEGDICHTTEVTSAPLNDVISWQRGVSPGSQGFGLTRDKLQEVGLSPTGYIIIGRAARTQADPESSHLSDDSDDASSEF